MAITTVGLKYPVRVVTGRTKSGILHAQAQVYIDEEWEWLEVFGWPKVYIGEAEYKMTDIKYKTGKEFLEFYKHWLKDREE